MRRRTAVVVCAAAVAVGAGTAVAVPLAASGSATTAGRVHAGDVGAATRLATAAPPAVSSSPAALSSPAAPSSAAVSTPAGAPAAVPVSVTVSGTGIAAPVTPVGVGADGDVAIPERVDTVGWYRFGAAPGAAAGSTVLVGHVDAADQGEGAFFSLHEVTAGATVALSTDRGVTLTYRVVGVAQYPKTSVPLTDLFSLDGAPRLTLITCGGAFDRSARSYLDNVVVTAVPA